MGLESGTRNEEEINEKGYLNNQRLVAQVLKAGTNTLRNLVKKVAVWPIVVPLKLNPCTITATLIKDTIVFNIEEIEKLNYTVNNLREINSCHF